MQRRKSFPTEVSLKKVRVWLLGCFRVSCRGPRIPQIVRCSRLYCLSNFRNYSMAQCEGVFISMFIGIVGNYLKTSSNIGILRPDVFSLYCLQAKSKATLGWKLGSFSYSICSIQSWIPQVLIRLESWCTTSLLSLVKHTSISSISGLQFLTQSLKPSRVFSIQTREPPLCATFMILRLLLRTSLKRGWSQRRFLWRMFGQQKRVSDAARQDAARVSRTPPVVNSIIQSMDLQSPANPQHRCN